MSTVEGAKARLHDDPILGLGTYFIDDLSSWGTGQHGRSTRRPSIRKGFRRVNIVRMAMNDGVNQWRTDIAAVRHQPDVVLHQHLTVRRGAVGWALALGDGVDYINNDEGTLLWVQP